MRFEKNHSHPNSCGISKFNALLDIKNNTTVCHTVKNYIEHLSQLQSVNEIRKQERRKEKQAQALKDVHCYDWKTLVEKGELDTPRVRQIH